MVRSEDKIQPQSAAKLRSYAGFLSAYLVRGSSKALKGDMVAAGGFVTDTAEKNPKKKAPGCVHGGVAAQRM